jgi:death-on-curing protein
MQEPVWITKAVALAIHERQLSEHGGGSGVRDEGLLESALGKPQNLFAYSDGTVDLAAMAASYAFGIARNHPFVDGNKRSALVISRTFLRLNDADIVATKEDKYMTFLGLAAGEVSEEELAAWFRKNIQ